MGLYDFSYLKRNGKYLTRNNKILYTYAQGLYSIEEIDALIAEGYIPVATATELDGLRHSSQRVMGSGTIWEGLYFTGSDKKYVQVGDIDYSTLTSITSFSGTYDGNNLYVTIDSLLFTTLGGSLKNINLTGDVTGRGCLAGYSVNSISDLIIDNCHVYCNLTTNNLASGGLVPDSTGTLYTLRISNSSFNGTINTAYDIVGGIVGEVRNSELNNVEFHGTINGQSDRVGGLIGRSESTQNTITDCHVNATIINVGLLTGGLVGQTVVGIYEKCSFVGTIESTGDFVGGLAGDLSFNTSKISNSYVHGEITGVGSNTGGAVGRCRNIVENIYSSAVVTGNGGLIGVLQSMAGTTATAINSYYDTQTSNQSDTGKGEPRTTIQLQQGTQDSFILPAGGIDPNTLAANAVYTGWSTAIWRFDPKNKYPRLK